MKKQVEYPKRAHYLKIDLQADTLEDLKADLANIEMEFRRDQLRTSIMGGASVSHIVEYTYDPEMTHDKFFALNDAAIAAERTA